MGVDLRLLVLQNSGTEFEFEVNRCFGFVDAICKLRTQALPADFPLQVTRYGNTMRCTKVRELLKIATHDGFKCFENRAIWNFLQSLGPNRLVALYFH